MGVKNEIENGLQEKMEMVKNQSYLGGLSQAFSRCQHCYCGSGIWNGREHLVCCICGHRTLKNPITS